MEKSKVQILPMPVREHRVEALIQVRVSGRVFAQNVPDALNRVESRVAEFIGADLHPEVAMVHGTASAVIYSETRTAGADSVTRTVQPGPEVMIGHPPCEPLASRSSGLPPRSF